MDDTVFEELFVDSNADILAKYIIENFYEGENREIDYDFSLEKGKMKGSGTHANLSLKFDTNDDSLASKIRDILCDERIEATKERSILLRDFLELTGNLIIGKYINDLRKKIRVVVFGEECSEKMAPLEKILFIGLDITDIPPENSILMVRKDIPKNVIEANKKGRKEEADALYNPSHGISEELFRISKITGENYETIIARKKIEGDPRYKHVTGIETKRYIYECQLDLYIDFSLVKPEEVK